MENSSFRVVGRYLIFEEMSKNASKFRVYFESSASTEIAVSS